MGNIEPFVTQEFIQGGQPAGEHSRDLPLAPRDGSLHALPLSRKLPGALSDFLRGQVVVPRARMWQAATCRGGNGA